MTQDRRGDALLAISRNALRLAIVVIAFTLALVAWAVAALLLFPSPSVAERLAAAPSLVVPAIVFSSVVGIGMLAMSLRFAIEFGRIIGTVQHGDPFVPANADRLARMGWLALGVTGATWLLIPIVSWLSQYFDELSAGGGTSLGGLALALTLFVLARIFRLGATMREDLQGTV